MYLQTGIKYSRTYPNNIQIDYRSYNGIIKVAVVQVTEEINQADLVGLVICKLSRQYSYSPRGTKFHQAQCWSARSYLCTCRRRCKLKDSAGKLRAISVYQE